MSVHDSVRCPATQYPLLANARNTGAPRPRVAATLTSDMSNNHQFFLFGGYNKTAKQTLDDLHIFDARVKRFHELHPQNSPPSRQLHSFTAVSRLRSSQVVFLLFGGLGDADVIFGDVWLYYPPPANIWVEADVKGACPLPRHSHVAVSAGCEVLMFGGVGKGCLDGSIWKCVLKEGNICVWEKYGIGPIRECAGAEWLVKRNQLVLVGGEDIEGANSDVWISGANGLKKVEVKPGLGVHTNHLPKICGHSLVGIGDRYVLIWGGVVEDDQSCSKEGFHDVWVIDLDALTSWRIAGVRGRRRVVSGVSYKNEYGLLEFGGAEDFGDEKDVDSKENIGMRIYRISEKSLDKWIQEVQTLKTRRRERSWEEDTPGLRDEDGRLKEGTYLVGHVVQSCEIGHWVEVFVDGERYIGMLMSKKVQGSLKPNSNLSRHLAAPAIKESRARPPVSASKQRSDRQQMVSQADVNEVNRKRMRSATAEINEGTQAENEAQRKRIETCFDLQKQMSQDREMQREMERELIVGLPDADELEATRGETR